MNQSKIEELWYIDPEETPENQKRFDEAFLQALLPLLKLKPIPTSTQQLLQTLNDPNYKIKDVETAINHDPSLTAHVLRVVNSASYGLTQNCKSLSHAITLLGTKRLSEIATALSLMRLFQIEYELSIIVRNHSTAIGGLTSYLSSICRVDSPDVFTCGLLHDIGKLLLLHSMGRSYSDMLISLGVDVLGLHHVVERKEFGYDHAVFGAHVLHYWNIPAPIPKVVAWHHQVERALELGGTVGKLVSLINLAEQINLQFLANPDFDASFAKHLAENPTATFLRLKEETISKHWSDFGQVIAQSLDFLKD